MKIIRVLHVFGSLDSNGAESRVMDIYRKINKDLIQFDFLVHSKHKGVFEDEILELGGRIYRVPKFNGVNIIKYIKSLNNIFTNQNFEIVHGHMLSTAFLYLRAAKKANIKVRIAHSRAGNRTKMSFTNILKELFKRLNRIYSTHKFAVSKVAAVSAFGNKAISRGNVSIIPNSIDVRNFTFNERIRNQVRKRLNFDSDEFVVGHIGRFVDQKNHDFLIDVFHDISKKQQKAKLVLIGDGPLVNKILLKIREKNLYEKVVYLGRINNVNEILQAIDCLIFPSFFEGLPGVILEAQAAALQSFISDTITKEVKLTNYVDFISLKKSYSYWAERILYHSYNERINTEQFFYTSGFDLNATVIWYEQFYLNVDKNR